MRKELQTIGFVLSLVGVSGLIDHLSVQPFVSFLLDSLNRRVFEKFDVFDGWVYVANAAVAVIGVVVMALGDLFPGEDA